LLPLRQRQECGELLGRPKIAVAAMVLREAVQLRQRVLDELVERYPYVPEGAARRYTGRLGFTVG
jgi:hypothetical protein